MTNGLRDIAGLLSGFIEAETLGVMAVNLFLVLLGLTTTCMAFAAPGVPERNIPPSVAAELKRLENQFELALSQDCPSDKCFSRGCFYVSHATTDKPKQGSLPGIGDDRGPGAVEAQEYLTGARCELATETSIPAKDRLTLVRRLEQKLGKGFTVVTVDAKQLPPLPDSLKNTPTPIPTASVSPTPGKDKSASDDKGVGSEIGKEGLFREFWLSVLPYIPGMLGGVLLTLCVLALIWAWRRLGVKTVEEKLMEATLTAPQPEPVDLKEIQPNPEKNTILDVETIEKAFVAEHSMLWRSRIEKDSKVLGSLFLIWLRDGDYAMLAKAVLEFDGLVKPEFPEDGEFAKRKLEFSEYLKDAAPDALPSGAEFYRILNQHALAATILSQSDAEIYKRIHEEFGPAGIRNLMTTLPKRLGAVLFSLLSGADQKSTALLMPDVERSEYASELLRSNRATRDDLANILKAARSVCDGKPVPAITNHSESSDHGQEINAASALSILLPLIPASLRRELVQKALKLHGGQPPDWMLYVFFPDMLLALTADQRTALMLNTDIASLAAWISEQHQDFREKLKKAMPSSLANALAAAASNSRRDSNMARNKLSENLVDEYSAQKLRWVDLVGS
ncbi:MAG: hypothetical protein ACO3A4_04685 [Silvanigrellaceae bacterium]